MQILSQGTIMLKQIAMVISVATLSACASVGQNFTAPKAGPLLEGSYRHAEQPQALAQASATLPAQWWTVFNDAALNRLQQRALQGNPGLVAAGERLLQAQAQLGLAHVADLPQVNLAASVANSRTSATTTQGRATGGRSLKGEQYMLAASMAYEVDLWGKVRRMNEAAAAQVEVAGLDRDGVYLLLASQVASTYWQWCGVNAEMAILQQSLASRQQSLQLVESRFANGIGNELDVSRARLESANAAADLHEVERQRNTLEHALAALVGASPAQALLPDVAAAGDKPEVDPPVIPAGLPAQLLAQRPDLAQSVASLRALNAQIGVAQTAFYPSLSLTGNFGYASQDLRDLAQGGSRQFSFGPFALSLPIFDGGKNRANLELAQSRYREALANHQSRLLGALREVEDALSDVEQKQKQGAVQVQAQQAAARAYAVAFARYEHGVSNYLDVTDAQRSSLAAQRAAVQIRTQRFLAATAVARALGGGWPGFGS
jgi:NodT family efflux transporter outer membrane factor (OMF) lipoprotein